jgi:hypothetical protein
MNRQLALDLTDLDLDDVVPQSSGGLHLETIGDGHGVTEVAASVCATSCCSCCLACCCCCW